MFRFVVNGQRGGRNILISIGLTLIIISLLVFLYPKFFAFIFAGLVGLLGLGAVYRGIVSKPPTQNKDPFNPYGGSTEEGSYQEVDD